MWCGIHCRCPPRHTCAVFWTSIADFSDEPDVSVGYFVGNLWAEVVISKYSRSFYCGAGVRIRVSSGSNPSPSSAPDTRH
jgi:hypothetical protein